MANNGINDLIRKIEGIANDLSKLQKKTSYTASYGINFDVRITKFPDLTGLINRVASEFKQSLAIELETALDNAMESTVWGGSQDGNIVDTGNLRDSLQISVTSNGVMIDYTAEYAALIHYGGYIVPYGNSSATRVYIEGRPWIDSVLYGTGPIPGYNFEELFNRVKGRVFG